MYSTAEAAELAGIHVVTLKRWLAAGRIRPSIAVPMGGQRTLWRWTRADVGKVCRLKGSLKPGPKPKKRR